ncbi:ankyrin repeat-containing domain protein [Xylariaceae sp. FL1651]|nr:ankyrin repeat-containing domain protein [Xylariaceae sp. FL1651]
MEIMVAMFRPCGLCGLPTRGVRMKVSNTVPIPGSSLTNSFHIDESSSKVDMYTFESIDHGLCNAVRRGDKRDSWTWLKRWTARPGFQDEMVKSQALHLAANAGLTSIVTDLLKNGFSVNATFNQSFPLHTAIGRAYTDTAKLLLEQGADPNARDSQHRTPLHFACTLGLEPVVQLLLDKGADVNATDVLLSTPLHQSVNSRRSAIVAKLLKQPGINVSVYVRELQASLTTPFFAAVLGGGVGIVQAFIDFGVNIQAEESFTHYTPLHAAASAEKLDVANLLIEKGADVNAPIGNEWGAPPVFIAIQRGDANMVRLLVESGAKTDAVDRGGFTAVHAMINFSHSELLPVLLQYGFDINMQNKAGQTPIVFALQLKKFESAQILLNEKASLHIGPASERRSLLHYAAVMNNLDILRFLHVQRDAIPVDTLDRENMTPLMRAAGFGHLEAATMLIQHGAGIEKRGLENRTALFIAVEYRRKEVVELLLSKGADVNVRAVNGMTPLHVAVIVENVEIARLLLDAGADTAAKDRQKKTALQWAKQRRSEEIVKLLGGTEMTSRFSFFRRRLRLPSR